MRSLVACAVVSSIAAIIYINTLPAGFVYDDSRAILKNRDLLPSTPWSDLLRNDFWGTQLTHSGSHRSYRPLCVLSFRLNYAVSQLSSAFSYHLVNVVLHSAVCTLYMYVCWTLLPRTNEGFWTCVLAGALFAVHPIHTEAVAGLVGRADIGSAFFFLLAFASYSRFVTCTSLSTKGLLWYLAVAVCTAAAMLTKEIGITVLGVCVLYDMLAREKMRLANLMEKIRRVDVQVRCLALCGIGSLLLLVRVSIMGGAPPSFSSSDNPAANDNSALTRFLTFVHLPSLNMLLFLCPRWLSFDWSMSSVPLVEGVADVRNVGSVVLYMLLLLLVLQLLKSVEGKYMPATWWCLLVMVVPFLPASNLLFYVGFVLAERVLYIPSLGYCLLVALGARTLWNRTKHSQHLRQVLMPAVIVLILTFSLRTWERNKDWLDEEALYRSGIAYNPAKAWGNLANVLKEKGDVAGAEEAYRSALSFRSNMADAHYNLGILLQEKKDYNGAATSYKNAISFRPTLALAHLNLGMVLKELRQAKESEKILRQCVAIPDTGLKDPTAHAHAVTSCYFTLGMMLKDQRRSQEAVDDLQGALHHAPPAYGLQSIYNLLGGAYAQLGNTKSAEENYRLSLRAKADHLPAIGDFATFLIQQNRPADAEKLYKSAASGSLTIQGHYGVFLCGQKDRLVDGTAMLERVIAAGHRNAQLAASLGECYRKAGKTDKAIVYYKMAAELNPTDSAYSNLGAVYHMAGKYKLAEEAYRQALSINPHSELAKGNLARLERSKTTAK